LELTGELANRRSCLTCSPRQPTRLGGLVGYSTGRATGSMMRVILAQLFDSCRKPPPKRPSAMFDVTRSAVSTPCQH
jgi:hypothetical protein